MSTALIVILILVLVAIVAAGVYVIGRRTAGDRAAGVTSVLGTTTGPLRMTATELIEGYAETASRHSLAGLTAVIEDSGTVNRRITATRVVLLGPLAAAAPKKLDDREVYITISGPATEIVRTVSLKNNPAAGQKAREFALRINRASATLGTAS